MKKVQYYIIALLMFLVSAATYAQPGRPFDEQGGGPPPERLERFKKMRLIEVLKLKEEESVRFFAKQSAHEEKVRDLMKERNETLDDMEEALEKQSDKDMQKYIGKVFELDEKLFKERQRFQEDVGKILTQEQYAKFFIFERDFGKQVRGAMEDVYKGRRERRRGNE